MNLNFQFVHIIVLSMLVLNVLLIWLIYAEDEALKIKNFGRKSLNEVKESMKAFGLSFGMNIKESR